MKKIIMVFVVLLMLVLVIINTSKNTSTTELLVNETRARNDIESIHGAIDVVGQGAFKGVEIDSPSFKGNVEQPASSVTNYLTTYKIKEGSNAVDIKYDKSNTPSDDIKVTGTNVRYVDLSIPANVRNEVLKGTEDSKMAMGTLYDFTQPGISPIVKDTKSAGWINTFLLLDSGMALERLAEKDPDFQKLVTAIQGTPDGSKGLDFMKVVFGNPEKDALRWKEYQADRIVAMKQVDTEALTGLGKGASIEAMTNPNIATIYQVDHINLVNLSHPNLVDPIGKKATLGGTAELDMVQLNKLVTHINQMLGGKLVLIPNRDTSVLLIDGVPTFVLN